MEGYGGLRRDPTTDGPNSSQMVLGTRFGGASIKMANVSEANEVDNANKLETELGEKGKDSENSIKIICLGDSAVGKSKLVERFLMDGYQPQQLSTYALTLFQYRTKVDNEDVRVDIWDTAGQERFNSMHPSYYHQAHACILAFDISRKTTYKNLLRWYKELREYRSDIPCIVVANKIDIDYKVTEKSFNFPKKYGLPFYFVSAADGTNVVKLFREAIKLAYRYKENSTDFVDIVMKELEAMDELDIEDEKFTSNEVDGKQKS